MGTPKMYRRFEINDYSDEFVITEIQPTAQHPINWCGPVQWETAWAWATSQAVQPIVVKRLDGTVHTHVALNEFNMDSFEQAAYHGYVAYGYSMSDGGYYPIEREQFVADLRRDAASFMEDDTYRNPIMDYNDCRLAVKNSFGEYAARRARSLVK
jgi:hypothetical protein